MKFSITIVLLAITSHVFAQSNNSESRSTKIDENEKKRLENQFKALNTFYINDDGLVVYQIQDNQTAPSKEETPATNTSDKSSDSKNAKSQESDKQLINEESPKPKSSQNANITRPQTVSYDEPQTPVANRANTSGGVLKKEAVNPVEEVATGTTADQYTETKKDTETRTIRNSSIQAPQEEEQEQPAPKMASTKAKNTTPPATTTPRKSVFDKKTKPSQFKTMEEAALAVEDLLEELRREQAQSTSAGSMSSRLSGGAGRSTLRKKPATNPSYNIDNPDTSTTPSRNQNNIVQEEISPFGNEPTYYINGKEVNRVEVNRLRKKEIISKEVRTRNTVSGNPNGEVWYEVRYDN